MCLALNVHVTFNPAVSPMALGTLEGWNETQGFSGTCPGTHRWQMTQQRLQLGFWLWSLYLNTSQLLLLSSTCPATSLGAMWLGLPSLTSLYYQTATDVGTWYISRELKLTLNLWIVFKACLKLLKPAILISKDMDHKALQKVAHPPKIKFWHKANNRLGSEQLWRAGHGCCIIIHVFYNVFEFGLLTSIFQSFHGYRFFGGLCFVNATWGLWNI